MELGPRAFRDSARPNEGGPHDLPRLPVPDPTPEVHHEWPDKLRLLDRANEHVCWLHRDEAQALFRRGEVETIHRKQRIRAVRWTSYSNEDAETGRFHQLRKTGYGDSHNQDRKDNPAGVWTIDHVRERDRRVFQRVLESIERRAA